MALNHKPVFWITDNERLHVFLWTYKWQKGILHKLYKSNAKLNDFVMPVLLYSITHRCV